METRKDYGTPLGRESDRELMQQALDALEDACGNRCNAENNPCWQREVATALRARLARQDNSGWCDGCTPDNCPGCVARQEQEQTIRYDGLYEFAAKHRIDYNELCRTVREAVVPPPARAAIAKHGGNHA